MTIDASETWVKICGNLSSKDAMDVEQEIRKDRLRSWGTFEVRVNQAKTKYIVLSLIVLLGCALRIYGLDHKSLWFDEVLSVNEQKDLQRLVSNIDFPGNLYFIILHFFMLFGNDEVAARLPSVIFGVLSVLLIYKVGELFFGRPKEGLIAAFLLSISILHVRYSQEARYYSLSMLLSLLSIFLFYKAIKEKYKKLWVGFIFSTTLAVLSHWYIVFIPLIEMLFLAFILIKNRSSFIMSARKIGKRKIFLLFLGLIILSALLLPLIQGAIYYVVTGWILRITWGLEPATFFQDLFSYFSFGSSFSLIDTSFLYMFLIFSLFGIFMSIKEHTEQSILLLLWVFLPTITVFTLTFNFGSPISDVRYMMFILPGYLVFISKGTSSISTSLWRFYYKIAYGVTSIPLKGKQVVISLVITVIILGAFAWVSVFPLQEYYKSEKENWRAAAEYLGISAHPGRDVIVVVPSSLMQCLLYYYERNYNMADSMKKITTSINNLKDLKDMSSEHDKVFFIFSPWHMKYINPEILDWVRRNFVEVRRFTGISINYHSASSIIISTKNMSFIGLDSPPDEPVANFWHDGDRATFNVSIPKAANYSVAIHATSGRAGKSALELVIDGASKGIKTFNLHDWSLIELATYYLDVGLHEIKIISREGGDIGDTGIAFDQVALLEQQTSLLFRKGALSNLNENWRKSISKDGS